MEDSPFKDELNEQLDEADELLLEMHKYGLRNERGMGRQDSKYLAGAGARYDSSRAFDKDD